MSINNDPNHRIDSIERALADSTRKLVSKLNIEWQKLMKYNADVSAKKKELHKAKERIMHLKEKKNQDEKYIDVAVKRLENLKLSGSQFKSKLSYLKKEEERIVKNCNERKEYMQIKISIYKDKWQKRYKSQCSKNPRIQEKERNIKIMEELKEKLCVLEDEYQKYEKELFQAKCERDRIIGEIDIFPFKNFVVKVAKIYVDTKNICARCEVITKEITLMENNIKNIKENHQATIKSKTPLNPESFQNAFISPDPMTTDERNISEKNTLLCKDYERNIDEENASVRKLEYFKNNLVNSDQIPNRVPFSKSATPELDNLRKQEIIPNQCKILPKITRVRKWMERFKIVSKFAVTLEGKENVDAESSALLENSEGNKELFSDTGAKNDEILKRSDTLTLINNREANAGILNIQDLTLPTRNVDNEIVPTNFAPQKISNITSRYFQKCYSLLPLENKATSNVEIKKVSFAEDNVKQKMLENAKKDIHEQMSTKNKNDLQQENRFEDVMDADEEVNDSEGCYVDDIHNAFQKEATKEMSCEDERSNAEKAVTTTHIEENIDSLNNGCEAGNQIQIDKMDVDELGTKARDDTQKCTSDDLKIVFAKDINQETAKQPSNSHHLNLEPMLMINGSNDSKNLTENAKSGVDEEMEQHLNVEKVSSSVSINHTLPAMEQTPKNVGSIPESNPPLTTQLETSSGETTVSDNFSFIPFKPEFMSPGFTYTSRLMHQAITSINGNAASSESKKDLQSNVFAPMSFFSSVLGNKIDLDSAQSTDEDKMECLASTYEDYLADSPPLIKGKEKSMFALAEDSPDKEDKNDFFPLFGANNGESNGHDGGAQFTLNFCGGGSSSKAESPEENTGFKFLF